MTPAHLALLACPRDQGGLREDGSGLVCETCATRYPVADGIARLRPDAAADPASVGGRIQAFYEEHPFPDYDAIDDPARLRARAERGQVASALDRLIGASATVVEVGCGTGQLVNYLALRPTRTVIGADLAVRPLEVAEEFRARHDIRAAAFIQMDVFAPALRHASFDAVICTGVLHHTADAAGGFRSLVRLVKPEGLVLIGLYNRFGRLPTDARRLAMRVFGRRDPRLDPRLRSEKWDEPRRRAWFLDQYANPHETEHTMDEVLGWFAKADVDFVASIPSATGRASDVFAPRTAGTRAARLRAQVAMIAQGGKYGGLFLMLGRRRAR